jgi:hypothetical protein
VVDASGSMGVEERMAAADVGDEQGGETRHLLLQVGAWTGQFRANFSLAFHFPQTLSLEYRNDLGKD